MREGGGRPGRSRVWLLLLGLLALGLYAPNWNDYFIGDDFDLIHSFYGEGPGYLGALLWSNESGDVWKGWGIDPALGRGYLRPLKIWLLALDSALWGTNPLGYHLTSTAFFAAVVLLVFSLLRDAMPERPALAAAGACAVALHPVFAELVPFITAREELTARAFGLASFAAFLRSALQRPFTASDLARVCNAIDARNLELTRARPAIPAYFDARIELDSRRFATRALERRHLLRLWREGIVARGERRIP